jgi:hypothetical protein
MSDVSIKDHAVKENLAMIKRKEVTRSMRLTKKRRVYKVV